MQITRTNNNINFTKSLLKTVTVRKTDGKNAIMKFVEYNIKNKKDARQISKLAKEWGEGAKYIRAISSSFTNLSACLSKEDPSTLEKYHFYGLENKFGKTLSLAQTTDQQLFFSKKPKEYMTLDMIQTKPKEMHTSSKRRYKGLGETLVSGIVEVAKKKNQPMIEISCANEGFWNQNTLFKKAEDSIFDRRTLHQKDYANYIKYVKNKTKALNTIA